MQFVPLCIAYSFFACLKGKKNLFAAWVVAILCLRVVYSEENAFFCPLEEQTFLSICRLYVIC